MRSFMGTATMRMQITGWFEGISENGVLGGLGGFVVGSESEGLLGLGEEGFAFLVASFGLSGSLRAGVLLHTIYPSLEA